MSVNFRRRQWGTINIGKKERVTMNLELDSGALLVAEVKSYTEAVCYIRRCYWVYGNVRT